MYRKIPTPLSNHQSENDYYCSLDSSYCDSKSQYSIDKNAIFNSVCSIEGGVSLCSDSKSFEEFYSTPPPDCSSGICVAPKKATSQDVTNIHKNFVLFYSDIEFTKVRNSKTHSVYACKVESGLMKDNQYLFAIVSVDDNILGTVANLSMLKWDSFQCRKLKMGYNIKSIIINNNVTDIMKGKIDVVKRTDEFSQYKCETLPVNITLLHKKVGNKEQYNSTGKLYLALNQYDTIITF